MTEVNEVKNEGKRSFYLKALLFMLIPAILARIFYLVYSNFATDITVSPVYTEIVRYTALLFTCIMTGAAFASITSAVYRYSSTTGIVVLLVFSLIFFADCIVRFLIDYIGGEIRYEEILAIITLLTEFFAQAAMAMCAWMISVAFHHLHELNRTKKLYSLKYASMAAFSIQFFVPFVRWIVTTFTFLNDVEWIPTSTEVKSMLTDLITIIVFYAGVIWIASRIVVHFLVPDEKTNKIT